MNLDVTKRKQPLYPVGLLNVEIDIENIQPDQYKPEQVSIPVKTLYTQDCNGTTINPQTFYLSIKFGSANVVASTGSQLKINAAGQATWSDPANIAEKNFWAFNPHWTPIRMAKVGEAELHGMVLSMLKVNYNSLDGGALDISTHTGDVFVDNPAQSAQGLKVLFRALKENGIEPKFSIATIFDTSAGKIRSVCWPRTNNYYTSPLVVEGSSAEPVYGLKDKLSERIDNTIHDYPGKADGVYDYNSLLWVALRPKVGKLNELADIPSAPATDEAPTINLLG